LSLQKSDVSWRNLWRTKSAAQLAVLAGLLWFKLLIHHKGIYKTKPHMAESIWQGSDYFESVPFPKANSAFIGRDNKVVLH
jgi:hypothetical protein